MMSAAANELPSLTLAESALVLAPPKLLTVMSPYAPLRPMLIDFVAEAEAMEDPLP